MLFDLVVTSDTGCIDEGVLLLVVCDLCIDGISCGTCNIRYDKSVLADELVDDTGLTNIG